MAWENELAEECSVFLSNVHLQVENDDKWMWQLDWNDVYSVRNAYVNTSSQVQRSSTVSYLIWHKDVPQKVSIFAWSDMLMLLMTTIFM